MEIKELSELCDWAEWAAFNRFADVLKNILSVLKERGIKFTQDTNLENRLTFVGYDRMNTVGDDLNFEHSIMTLNLLWSTHQSQCLSPEISEFQFLRIREKTLLQWCISKLYMQLGLDNNVAPPQDPRKLVLPASFSLEVFGKEVETILTENKVYSSNVVLDKIENEFHKNIYMVLVDSFAPDSDGKLSKEKVKITAHYLLHQYPFPEYTAATTAFSRKLESLVLPAPTISPQTAASFAPIFNSSRNSVSASAPVFRQAVSSPVGPASSSRTKDWSEGTKNKKGPYASPATASSADVHIKTSSSSKKRNAKSPKANQVRDSPAQKGDEVDTDEQSGDDEVSHPPGKRSRNSTRVSNDRVKEVTSNLRETSKVFRATNVEKDPLQEALNVPGKSVNKKPETNQNSPGRVVSVVGEQAGSKRRLRSAAKQLNDEISQYQSDEEVEGKLKPKKSLTSSRTSAVADSDEDYEDSIEDNDEDDEDYEDTAVRSTIASKRAQLEIAKEKYSSFPQKLQVPARSTPFGSAPGTLGKGGAHTNQSRTRWTSDEEDALLQGVEKYGMSEWALIRDDLELCHRFNNRTNTNLKDKYRNLQKKGIIDK